MVHCPAPSLRQAGCSSVRHTGIHPSVISPSVGCLSCRGSLAQGLPFQGTHASNGRWRQEGRVPAGPAPCTLGWASLASEFPWTWLGFLTLLPLLPQLLGPGALPNKHPNELHLRFCFPENSTVGLGTQRRTKSLCLGGLEVTFALVLKMPCRTIPGRGREKSLWARNQSGKGVGGVPQPRSRTPLISWSNGCGGTCQPWSRTKPSP